MTCRHWEERIAADWDGPDVERHLAGCSACRGFADELRRTIAELRAGHGEEIAPAHYAAVRARVMEGLRRRSRRGWIWAMVASAAAVAMGVAIERRMRVEELSVSLDRPAVVDLGAAPAGGRMPARTPARRAKSSLHEEVVMKIETGDPDVVIYWIAQAKGED